MELKWFYSLISTVTLVRIVDGCLSRTNLKLPASVFNDGENLSIEECGVWNREATENMPWAAEIKISSEQECFGVLISKKAILSPTKSNSGCEILAQNLIQMRDGGTNNHYHANLGKHISKDIRPPCSKFGNEVGLSLKVLGIAAAIDSATDADLYVFKIEKIDHFTDFYRPICLYNRGSGLKESNTGTYLELWKDHSKVHHTEVLLANGMASCMTSHISKELDKFNSKCEAENCTFCAKHYCPHSSILMNFYQGRYFVLGLKNKRLEPDPGFTLYLDLSAFNHRIVQNVSDLAIFPKIPPPKPMKRFNDGEENLSFPSCSEKMRPRRELDEFSEFFSMGLVNRGRGRSASRDHHPWHAEIRFRDEDSGFCGGSLISKKAVLTAAHCFYHYVGENQDDLYLVRARELVVSIGLNNVRHRQQAGIQAKTPNRIIIHDNFNLPKLENDVALLIVGGNSFTLTAKVQPICLWNEDFDLNKVVEQPAMVAGWGLLNERTKTDILQEATLPIRSHFDCYMQDRFFFGRLLKPGLKFCAGHSNGTSVCNGDSGGGLMVKKDGRWFIRGIVSSTRARIIDQKIRVCDPNYYSLIIDLANYLDWIVENTPDM